MKRYTIEEKDWLKSNYSNLGSKTCAKYLNRPISSIRKTANKLGCYVSLQVRNKLHSNTLVESFIPSILPDTFINVKNKETAYVLGILWADGWISTSKNYSINIKLIEKDFLDILPVFHSLGSWKEYRYSPLNRNPTLQLRLSGKKLIDFFISMDYDKKSIKSAIKIISHIPADLQQYWWRGYFDGDGYISPKHPYRLNFCSSINQDWSFLPEKYNFYIKNTKGKYSYSKAELYSKDKILEFGNMIWKDWNIGLNRKYKKFQYLKKEMEC